MSLFSSIFRDVCEPGDGVCMLGVSNLRCLRKGILSCLGAQGHLKGHRRVPGAGSKWRSKLRRERVWGNLNNWEWRNMRTRGELRERKGCPRAGGRNQRGGKRGHSKGAGGYAPVLDAYVESLPSTWRRGYSSGSLCTYRKSQRHHRCQCPCEEKDRVL